MTVTGHHVGILESYYGSFVYPEPAASHAGSPARFNSPGSNGSSCGTIMIVHETATLPFSQSRCGDRSVQGVRAKFARTRKKPHDVHGGNLQLAWPHSIYGNVSKQLEEGTMAEMKSITTWVRRVAFACALRSGPWKEKNAGGHIT